MSGMLNTPVNIDLYDLTGRKVWTASFLPDTYAHDMIEITPPSHLAMGSYILSINNTYKIKLVKQP